MDPEEEGVYRLEGAKETKGGLVVKKKQTSTFKVPQPSLLGLDRLAAQKRKEQQEVARKMSFAIDDEESGSSKETFKLNKGSSRKFRAPQEETPTYTGGIAQEARARLLERTNRNKEKGVFATTKADHRHNSESRSRARDRERYKDRNRSRDDKSDRSSKRDYTPKFKDEPKTPNLHLRDPTSKSSWDDEDEPIPMKRSAWDYPTPSSYKSRDISERSFSSRDRYKKEYDTPRVTPAHKFNQWIKDRKVTGATPGISTERDEKLKWASNEDRENWEEEQKRLDREWYNMDEGYDEEHNPFSGVSEEYTKKKEEQIEQRKKKRLSAQQRQINKDNELWERNRMLTSGMYNVCKYCFLCDAKKK